MDVDPAPAVTEPAAPVVTESAAPEATVLEEDVPPEADRVVVVDSSSPPVPPKAPMGKVIEKSPFASAAVQGKAPTSSIPISIDIPVEDAIVGGLKESLAKASQFELRLRDLASEAESLKTNMHVSTYVSFPLSGCSNNFHFLSYFYCHKTCTRSTS